MLGNRRLDSSSLGFTRNELLEQEGILRQRFCCFARQHRREFITQCQQARRFQSDNRDALSNKWTGHLKHASGFVTCLVDKAG